MQVPSANFWPTARHYAEAVQCPAVCFAEPSLKGMLPAVDRLGMPLVTSGQFAYVFKLNPAGGGGESLAVRCFRGFLGDREERYRALDAHLNSHHIPALPRFKYLPQGVLVAGRRYPVLVMEWVEGPTLDVFLDEAVGRRDALLHLADEWVRLVAALREAGIAHGDLQHGNIIVEHGRLRLVDLDGMYVPALEGFRASEVGHQHYQHPARDPAHFTADTDNFSALVVYLSLVALAERPELWREHHDENLIFTRADFADPDSSALFPKIEAIGEEHARLARALRAACRALPSQTPPLTELVAVSSPSALPSWMSAPPGVDVRGRTREVAREAVMRPEAERPWASRHQRATPTTPASGGFQGLFNAQAGGALAASAPAPVVRDPSDVRGNTLFYAKSVFGNSYGYIWWIPLHNFVLRHVWLFFGVGDIMAGMLLTLTFLAALLFVYGFLRALKESQSGAAAAPAARPAQGVFQPTRAATPSGTPAPASLFAPAPPPAVGPAGAAPTASAPPRPVVGNSSLGIYHLPACDWVARIAPRRRADFDSPDAARAAHFRPCRVCQP